MTSLASIPAGWDAEEARMDGGVEADEHEQDALEAQRFWASLYATANENGETRNMENAEEFDSEVTQQCEDVGAIEIGAVRRGPPPLPRGRLASGVYAKPGDLDVPAGSAPLTVEEIDALPGPQERDRKHEAAALAALSFLSINTLHRVIGELLSHVDDERASGLMCSRLCRMQLEEVQRVGKQAVQLIGNTHASKLAIEVAARDERLGAEAALVDVIRPYAHLAVGSDG